MATPVAMKVCTDIPDGRLHVRFAAGDGSEVRGYLTEGETVHRLASETETISRAKCGNKSPPPSRAGSMPAIYVNRSKEKNEQQPDTLHFLKNDTFRFDPKSCRSANVTLLEAKFLRWLFLAERSNVDVIQNFGLGLAYKLLKQGFVDNPLGVQDTAQTNLWKLTEDGLNILKTITGVKS